MMYVQQRRRKSSAIAYLSSQREEVSEQILPTVNLTQQNYSSTVREDTSQPGDVAASLWLFPVRRQGKMKLT